MDQGSRNGSHTNHDRDQRHNGVNGGFYTSEKGQEKGKGRAEPQQNMTPISPTIPNGMNGTFSDHAQNGNGAGNGLAHGMPNRIDQLPPEILHITDGYMPLSLLLSRLAQKSYSGLLATVNDMAQMPSPPPLLNGNASHTSSADDNSPENQAKKKRLLDFVTPTHEAWLKALVITGWSRKAEEVSRAIDIKAHEDREKMHYINAIDLLAGEKRKLILARMPNPDLKTAVPVLTTGKAHWMPDLGYIPPAPLTAKEVLQSLEKLNTLLSIRLNLNDFEAIPPQFKEYTIKSGRATFRVEGEFELDLTIADEDPKSQFWFIDFRFLFTPSAPTLSLRVRNFIENKVNEISLKDGLSGCYKYLHETVLTYKISECKRQAIDLARAKWTDTLRVDGLNRALSVQYWLNRYNGFGSKSWVIIGVHSGKPDDDDPDSSSTSRLFLRWFRDHKEIKDGNIPFDTVNLSIESLLKILTAKHISHIFTAIFDKLILHPIYANKELSFSLTTSANDPSKPELKVQLTNEREICVKIDPISGRFVFSPTNRMIGFYENSLNAPSTDPKDPNRKKIEDPVDKAVRILEFLRYKLLEDDIYSRGMTFGWPKLRERPGIKPNVLSEKVPKNTQSQIWLRRPGWAEDWYLLTCLSTSGARWFLIKLVKRSTPLDPNPNAIGIAAFEKVPINVVWPTINYSFLSALNVYTTAFLSQYANCKYLYDRRVGYQPREGKPSKSLSIPYVCVRLTDLLPQQTRRPWARDYVKLTFQGVEVHATTPDDLAAAAQSLVAATQSSNTSLIQRPSNIKENAVVITEARMTIPLPKAIANLDRKVDPDIAFNPATGTFAFRLRSAVGEPVIPEMKERIVSIERLVQFVQVLQKHEKTLHCETVSLGKIVFLYSHGSPGDSNGEYMATQLPQYRATVDFSTAEKKMKLILEKGNPHIRIADFLGKVLNTTEGLNGVATILALTLPVLKGLNAIENAWDEDALYDRGEAFVSVRAADWYIIRYNLKHTGPNPDSAPVLQKVLFEVRLRERRGDPWWCIQRTNNNPRPKETDNLDDAFKPLWTSNGANWRGMRKSGVAQGSGAEELLVKMDEVVRNFALSDAIIRVREAAGNPTPAPAARQAPTQAPPSRQQQQQQQLQQQRQQPTPNQSQSQSQGRGQQVKRQVEFVEID
ncbi:related to RNA polymerase II mediator complex protein pmc1 [Phialocephala subalpina]|uniref:Mediator of RNA polymerase II transcription subunit 14 n=1 Tax=Phialocephala subalpina TaxID=576137 RepID=A0A1L7WCJ1_9HELO|nr:related to RNA polymerase II mediator complex protein pmc1 [Phialocephala subalpina]